MTHSSQFSISNLLCPVIEVSKEAKIPNLETNTIEKKHYIATIKNRESVEDSETVKYNSFCSETLNISTILVRSTSNIKNPVQKLLKYQISKMVEINEMELIKFMGYFYLINSPGRKCPYLKKT